MQIDRNSARVRVPPPLVFLGALLLGFALGKALGEPRVPALPGDLQNLLAWLGIVAGGGIALSALGLFRKAGVDPRPWRSPAALITEGVYRWTRNPMYLGMALAYAGIALLADSLVALVLLAPVMLYIQREVIAREEAHMEARFGERYLAYKDSARRWI